MDIKEIKRIIELMKANELSEFELEEENFRIAIKRKNGSEQPILVSSGPAAAPVILPAAAPAPAAAAGATASGDAASAAGGGQSAAAASGFKEIPSPMVGTFYVAPSPDADPFVSVGDTVEPDTVVCIIEAMKVMNEIKADIRGVVKQVLVESAMPVEFGQPLFLIDPS